MNVQNCIGRSTMQFSGNITEKSIGSDTVRMTYDKANQIVSMQDARGQRRFEYDSAGRMIRESLNGEPVASFTYGYLDKVTSVIRLRADSATDGQARGGDETHFHYNASGMLVGKSKSHSTGSGLAGQRLELWQLHVRRSFCEGGEGLALVARGDDAYVNESHISGASALMSRSLSEGDERYLLTDYLGTTLAAFDAKGDRNEPTEATAWNYTRTSFGAGADSPEAMSRFTGKPYDADLGAHVFPYRNYRSDMGRWMSADPIGFPDGPNQHFYAPVPTMGVDPWGLFDLIVNVFGGTQQQREAANAALNNIRDTSWYSSNDTFSTMASHIENTSGLDHVTINLTNGDSVHDNGVIYLNVDSLLKYLAFDNGDEVLVTATIEEIVIHEMKHLADFWTESEYSNWGGDDDPVWRNEREKRAIEFTNTWRSYGDHDRPKRESWYDTLEN